MSLYNISIRILLTRSLCKISRSSLLAESLCEILVDALCTSSIGKTSVKDLVLKTSAQHLLDDKNEHRATVRGLRQGSQHSHAQNAGRVARAISKFAPCHNESDLTGFKENERVERTISKFAPRHNETDLNRTKCREGCVRGLRATVSCETSVKNGSVRVMLTKKRSEQPENTLNGHQALTITVRTRNVVGESE